VSWAEIGAGQDASLWAGLPMEPNRPTRGSALCMVWVVTCEAGLLGCCWCESLKKTCIFLLHSSLEYLT